LAMSKLLITLVFLVLLIANIYGKVKHRKAKEDSETDCDDHFGNFPACDVCGENAGLDEEEDECDCLDGFEFDETEVDCVKEAVCDKSKGQISV